MSKSGVKNLCLTCFTDYPLAEGEEARLVKDGCEGCASPKESVVPR